jgi:hypothetical protein
MSESGSQIDQGRVQVRVGEWGQGSVWIQSPAAPVTIVAGLALVAMIVVTHLFLRSGYRPRTGRPRQKG